MLKQAIRFGFAAVVITMMLGAKGGCSGGVSPAKGLCEKTGGTWDSSKCPANCWPAACGQPANQTCPAGCGEEAVCKCPANAPFWKDGQGCWSQAQCDATCQGTASTCTSTSNCSQDGCFRDSCYVPRNCTGQRWYTEYCTRQEQCYHADQCYKSEDCYDPASGTYYECGYYYNCGYYYDCPTTYDCGHWETYSYDCSYYEDCGPCQGSAKACTAYDNQNACQKQAGCLWK